MSDDEDYGYGAWYSGEFECIRVALGEVGERSIEYLNIRDAVYFRHLLDQAINDYEKASGRE